MSEKESKEKIPVLAICYDFDKTLSPDDMQAQGYIQSIGHDIKDFWTESNNLAKENEMDQNLAWMFKMLKGSEGKLILNKKQLENYGAKVTLFPGVEEWFERICKYAEYRNVMVEHYIISSGLKEMIEGTSIAKKNVFKKIYASSFYYDPETGVAKWPAQVINYTNKTQFLFRIEKGTLDISDQEVNESFSSEETHVPFCNMVYIGDSDTDIPCMKLVNSRGGHSIGVYNSKTNDKSKVYKMVRDKRIKYYASADYSENSELNKLVKSIIDSTVINEKLKKIYYKCKVETDEVARENSEADNKKMDLLIDLECSRSFSASHSIIEKLRTYDNWTLDEKERLFKIAVENSQVLYILSDQDIKYFYNSLFKNSTKLSENAQKVKDIINS